MIEFEKPNIECLEVDDANNYAKFVCEPLERGYGVTIGNSLRRILLSSLPGCAITSVKIDGVLHEFSAIDNVVEDVPELIVNLKNIRLKFDGDEEKVLRIEAKGEGEVLAGDIITDGTVEILNPDLHIATIAEGGNLRMEMTADRGRGYNSSEITPTDIYYKERGAEKASSNTLYWDGKVGLMYPSDYGFSSGSKCSQNITLNKYNETCANINWLFLNNNTWEWFLTHNSSDTNYAFSIYSNGLVYNYASTVNPNSVRPVFYLSSNAYISKGIGTIDNPYQVIWEDAPDQN